MSAVSFKCQARLQRSRGDLAKLSQNLRYNPGFPASDAYLLRPEVSARMSLRILSTWVQLITTVQLQDREEGLGGAPLEPRSPEGA